MYDAIFLCFLVTVANVLSFYVGTRTKQQQDSYKLLRSARILRKEIDRAEGLDADRLELVLHGWYDQDEELNGKD